MVLAPAVIDLAILATFVFLFAFCLTSKKFVEAVFQVADSALGWIPWLGSRITGPLHSIEQRITQKLGALANSLSARIGSTWHAMARLVEEVGAKIEDAYSLLRAVTDHLDLYAPWKPVLDLYQTVQTLLARFHVTTKAQAQAVARAGRMANDASRRANTAQARAQAIPADVVVPGDLAGLRGRVREAEDEIGRLWDRVKGLAVPSVAAVGVAAIASVLGRLGVGWARCSNVGKVGRNVCGMDFNLLESLLADSLLVVGSLSLVEFAHEMVGVTDLAVRPITDFWRAS